MNGANIPPPEHYGMDGYYYQPGLWPDQPWKVRLEFIQRSGFSDDEMVTFTNVPVKPGSQQDWDDEWVMTLQNQFTFCRRSHGQWRAIEIASAIAGSKSNSSGKPNDDGHHHRGRLRFQPQGNEPDGGAGHR